MIAQKRRGIGRVPVAIAIAAIVVLAGIATSSYLMAARTPGASGTTTASAGSSTISVGTTTSQQATSRATSVQSSTVSSNSSLSQSTVQYPLVWGPNPVSACAGIAFCVYATLGLSGQTATNNTSSATTIIQGNATTIVRSSVTTIIRANSTAFDYPSPNTSYTVTLSAFVQDAVTSQNATTPNGIPVVASGCYIQPAGFTQCIVGAPYMPVVPSGDPYRVTVFVTMNYLPCSLQKANLQCSSQLLAPPSPAVTGDFEG